MTDRLCIAAPQKILGHGPPMHGSSKKYPDSEKFLHFRQSVLCEILAPAVFDYEDSKSESWHSAKKIREVFLDYKSPPPLFCTEKL